MIEKAVIDLIAGEQQCPQETITPDTRLDDLGIDSLKAITILYQLEEQFDIEIPNELIESIVTVNDIVTGLNKLLQNSDSKCRGA